MYYIKDVLKGLQNVDSNSMDIIICDPPYSLNKSFKNDNLPLNEYVEWCIKWMDECVRVLKPTGSLFIYGFSEILAHLSVNLKLDKRWLIWHYKNKAVPSYKSGFQRSHESIIYAWKDKPIFNVDDVRIPYTENYLKQVGKKRTASETARYGNSADTVYSAHELGALPRDVFTDISTLAGSSGRKERYFLLDNMFHLPKDIKTLSKEEKKRIVKHETQKPFALTERLLLASKPKEGCKVLIPFGGSGSEGVVCKKLNLDFVGFEIDETYVHLANEAVKNWKKIYQ